MISDKPWGRLFFLFFFGGNDIVLALQSDFLFPDLDSIYT